MLLAGRPGVRKLSQVPSVLSDALVGRCHLEVFPFWEGVRCALQQASLEVGRKVGGMTGRARRVTWILGLEVVRSSAAEMRNTSTSESS